MNGFIFKYKTLEYKSNYIRCQALIQKEKVHIDYEKSAQISILANKIATQ